MLPILVLALILAGCETDIDNEADEPPAPSPTGEATPTPEPAPENTATPDTAEENDIDTAEYAGIAPMPLLSRDAPVSASSEIYPAEDAVSDDYDLFWRGEVPSTFEVDLSEHGEIETVMIAWYSDMINSEFDFELSRADPYNLPRDYTISVSADGNDWQEVEEITGNRVHSRQHLVEFSGQRYIRLEFTAVHGSEGNDDVALVLDVHDASAGADDNLIIFGDSITVGATGHKTPTLSQLVQEQAPEHFPVQHSAGMSGWHASDGANHIDNWLPMFESRFVGLAYGTNDALTAIHPDQFADSMQRMIDSVNEAGKIAVLPTIPYATHELIQENQPGLNDVIEELAERNEGAISGPDLYSAIAGDPDLVSDDMIHPTEEGLALLRSEWASFMVDQIYQSN